MPSLSGNEDRTHPGVLDDVTLSDLFGHEVTTGAHVTAIRFLSETMAAGLGDGTVRFWTRDEAEPESVRVHAGAILVVDGAPGEGTILTGGDDGRICRVGLSGVQQIGESRGKWIDAVAATSSGDVAFSHGKSVTLLRANGSRRVISMPSTVAGLAFAPNGMGLAIAHYGGVTLADLNTDPSSDRLFAWAGSHVGVRYNPDSRFVVSTINENALHGWRIEDGSDMRMSGYPAKPKAMAWSPGEAWLATSGADCVVLWPFKGVPGLWGIAR